MNRQIRTLAFLLTALSGLLVGSARAQESAAGRDKPADQPHPAKKQAAAEKSNDAKPLDSVTIEKIMDQAVKNISRRYSLNDVQSAKTAEIMKRGVHEFLAEHEDDVWPLIRELLASGLRPPENIEDVRRIGKAARPLAELAHRAIIQGNDEWRTLLNAEQKRLHDYDLAEMEKTFNQIDDNFEKWAMGAPPDGSFFPPPPSPELGPPQPKKPDDGQLPPPEVEVFDPRTIFDTYVEEFIKDYALDEAQIVTARSILDEFKSKANDFRNAKKQELAKLAEDMRAALEGRDRAKMTELEAERKELLSPVYELFGQMEERLMALLTTAQKERPASAGRASDSKPQVRTVRDRDGRKAAKQRPAASDAGKTDDEKDDSH
jgi:hypothetical protein